MIIQSILSSKFTAFSVRIACLILIRGNKFPHTILDKELKLEVDEVLKAINLLPADLVFVLAWETMSSEETMISEKTMISEETVISKETMISC